MADLSVSVGLDASAFQAAIKGMTSSARSFAQNLQRDFAKMNGGQAGLEAWRVEQMRASDAQKEVLRGLIARNEQERQTQIRLSQSAELERGRIAAIDRITSSLQQQAASLGKTSAQMQIYELKSLGATREQIKQAQAIHAQIEAHERLNRLNLGGGGALLIGAGAVGGVGGLIRLSDEYTTLHNRMKIVHNSQAEIDNGLNGLSKIARNTGGSLAELGTIYQRLAQNSKALNLSQQDALALTDTIGKAVSLGGGSAESSAAAIQQFSQALASGVLRGEEFNSVMEQAPALAMALAHGLGVPIGQLRNMANNGELSANRVVKALQDAKAKVDADFGRTDMTIGNTFQVLHDKAMQFVGSSAQSSHSAKIFGSAVLFLADNIDTLAAALTVLAGAMTVKWAITGAAQIAQMTAAIIAQRTAATATASASAVLDLNIKRMGAATAIAAAQTNTLSGSLAVLRASMLAVPAFPAAAVQGSLTATATAATTARGALAGMAAGVQSGFAKMGLAAVSVTGAISGLGAALNVLNGRDASNMFSRMADSLFGLDSQTETIGTKLHDWFGNAKKANAELSKSYQMLKAMSAFSGKSAAVDKSGGFIQHEMANLELSGLQDSIHKISLKYKEQEQTIGKTTEELELLRLSVARENILQKQRIQLEQAHKDMPAPQRNRLIEESLAKTTKSLDDEIAQVKQSMANAKAATDAKAEADKRAAQAAQYRNEIEGSLKDFAEKVAQLGKSESEITQMQLAAKGATDAELKKVAAMQEVVRQYEKQASVMKSLEDLRDQLDRIGKTSAQIKLDDLRKNGASESQIAEAAALLNAIAAKEAAQKALDNAGNKMMLAGDKMLSAADDTARRNAEIEAMKHKAQAERLAAEQAARAEAEREAAKRATQGGLSDMEWLKFSKEKYGHDFWERTKEYQEAVKAATQTTDDLASGLAAFKEKFAHLNVVLPAPNVPNTNSKQPEAIAQAAEMGTIVLDLRFPNAQVLTGKLFGEKAFLEQLKTQTQNNVFELFNDVRTAVRS